MEPFSMNAPRYFLAKYVPDLRRGEPRNIGIILWSTVGVAARFLAEKTDRLGEVDARRIPAFVTSRPAYKQWVEYWRAELARPEVESVARPGTRVSRSSAKYLDVLSESSRGNFLLTEGGLLLDAITDPEDALDYLFERLVETPSAEEPRDPTLDEICDLRIEAANLRDDPHFLTVVSVQCELTDGITESFEFSHAYHNGSIRRLYQRIPMSPKKSWQRKTVHDAAWMFDRVIRADIVARHDAVALVYLPDDSSSEIGDWLRVLQTVSRIINVGDQAAAEQEFRSLPALAQH
jgi:hypothetical protein